MRGKIKERNDRLHRREEMAGLQRSSRIKKWTTFSWAPPTERGIGRDSDWEMGRNEERGADGTEELGVKVGWGKWIEKNTKGDWQRSGRCFLNYVPNVFPEQLWVNFVLLWWPQSVGGSSIQFLISTVRQKIPILQTIKKQKTEKTKQIFHFLFPKKKKNLKHLIKTLQISVDIV